MQLEITSHIWHHEHLDHHRYSISQQPRYVLSLQKVYVNYHVKYYNMIDY